MGSPEGGPVARGAHGAQRGHRLRTLPRPAHPGPLLARLDQGLAQALHRAGANGELLRHVAGVVHARRVVREIGAFATQHVRRRGAGRDERVKGGEDRGRTRLIEGVLERFSPGREGVGRVEDGATGLPEVRIGVEEVEDLDHHDTWTAHKVRRAGPDPLRAVAEHDHAASLPAQPAAPGRDARPVPEVLGSLQSGADRRRAPGQEGPPGAVVGPRRRPQRRGAPHLHFMPPIQQEDLAAVDGQHHVAGTPWRAGQVAAPRLCDLLLLRRLRHRAHRFRHPTDRLAAHRDAVVFPHLRRRLVKGPRDARPAHHPRQARHQGLRAQP